MKNKNIVLPKMMSLVPLTEQFILIVENYSDGPEKGISFKNREGTTFEIKEYANELKPTFVLALMWAEKVLSCVWTENF